MLASHLLDSSVTLIFESTGKKGESTKVHIRNFVDVTRISPDEFIAPEIFLLETLTIIWKRKEYGGILMKLSLVFNLCAFSICNDFKI